MKVGKYKMRMYAMWHVPHMKPLRESLIAMEEHEAAQGVINCAVLHLARPH